MLNPFVVSVRGQKCVWHATTAAVARIDCPCTRHGISIEILLELALTACLNPASRSNQTDARPAAHRHHPWCRFC